ncbi:uncharacterized protein LOC120339081 [Styela clava]
MKKNGTKALPFICFCLLGIFVHLADATRKATCNGWTLKAPDEGSFQCTPLGVTISMPGTRCTLFCDAGYRAQQEVLVCSETGGWVPTNTPECLVDSTMTLVIVLSIVGSIIIIFGLSVLYAKTSKRCRGKRRKLEEEDPETGRSAINDTSAYYGHVKRLRRKRRLQAERQKQVVERPKKKGDSIDKTKPASKQQGRGLKRDDKKREILPTKVDQKDKGRNANKKTKPLMKNTKERLKAIPKTRSNRKPPMTKVKEKRIASKSKPLATKETKKSFSQILKEIFCGACLPKKTGNQKIKSNSKTINEDVKIFSISESKSVPRPSKSSSSDSSSFLSSSESSSSFSSSSDEDESPPPKQSKKVDNTETPTSRANKPPQKPQPPGTKKPPPRPPAPKILQNKTRKASSDILNHSGHSPKTRSSEDITPPARHGISSGYSSEGDRHKRRRGHSESGIHRHSDDDKTLRNHSAIEDSGAKRMDILSPGPLDAEKLTGNPYEDYPSALSYRQYQNFENDYRRTTGDYHPQYSNIKLIPIQTTKKKSNEEEENERREREEAEKEAQKKARQKMTQGGVKYISIDEEDGGKDEVQNIRSNKKQERRYEDPSARDKRRHSPDYHKRHRAHKQTRKDKSSKRKDSIKRDRKREIEDERIIDDGKKPKMGKNKKERHSSRNHVNNKGAKRKETKSRVDAKRSDKNKK